MVWGGIAMPTELTGRRKQLALVTACLLLPPALAVAAAQDQAAAVSRDSSNRVMFRIDNVLNKYALSNIALTQLVPGDPFDPVYGSGVPIQPRTYQLSLEARF